jgi:DNA topoisomerase-1
MSPYTFTTTTATITAPLDLLYTTSVEIPVFLGWKTVTKGDGGCDSGKLLFLQSVGKGGFTHQTVESVVESPPTKPHYCEASLIKKLEDLGIGRPSTFSMIVDTIQERGYVSKQDVEGVKNICIEYILSGKELIKKTRERVFGGEKNKLVLQPLGKRTLEFLLLYFEPLFSYSYTKKMEDQLDLVANNQSSIWYESCRECCEEIKQLGNKLSNVERKEWPIDGMHSLCFSPSGPFIKCKTKDTTEFLSIKPHLLLDIEKIKTNQYTLEELIEKKREILGILEGKEVFVRNGKFGMFVVWDNKKHSLKGQTNKSLQHIVLEDVKDILLSETRKPPSASMLRDIDSTMSVRKGKFGPYIFYKTPTMKKPSFFSLSGFPHGFAVCKLEDLKQWVHTTYLEKS